MHGPGCMAMHEAGLAPGEWHSGSEGSDALHELPARYLLLLISLGSHRDHPGAAGACEMRLSEF